MSDREVERLTLLLEMEREYRKLLEQKLEKAEHDRDRYKKYIESYKEEECEDL